jgi:type I restriction enzyme S subunit
MKNKSPISSWQEYSFSEIAKKDKFAIVDGPFGTQLHSDEYTETGIPLVRIENLSFSGKFSPENLVFISEKKANQLNRSRVVPGDLIIAKTGATIGKSGMFPKTFTDGIIASSCMKVSCDPKKVDPKLILYMIVWENGQKKILEGAGGSTRTSINIGPFSDIRLLIPESISEQHKIAEILTTVDDAIEQTEALIRKHQRIKQGLMQDLLTRGVDANGEIRGQKNHRFKNSEIGPIPYEWEVIDFEHLVNHITARWIPRNTGGSFPCLNLENIESETGQVNGFSDAIENASTKTIFQKGDILFGKLRPYLKKYWIADVDGVCTTEILVFRAQRSIDHRYIYYLVQSEKFINYTISSSFGTKMPRTSWEIIKRYKIGKPDFEEQTRISKILSINDSQIEISQVELSKLNSLKQGLMQDLLTGKVRVNALLKTD